MNVSRAVRVVIADDHATVLSAVESLIEGEPGFEVVGTCDNGSDVVDLARDRRADLALVDVHMPAGGAAAARALRALRPAPVVVALSGQTASATLEDLLLAGVTGFVTKGHAGTDLLDVLGRCARGEVVLASPAAAAAVGNLVARCADPTDG